MAFNVFDLETTRRLSLSLMASGGALLFAAFNLIGAGLSADNRSFAVDVSASVYPLAFAAWFGFLAFICAELAAHPAVPEEGHPHSKRNYLETAFAFITVAGIMFLVYGGAVLVRAASIH